jgi:hypothetical protein
VGDPERELDVGIHGFSSLPRLPTGMLHPLLLQA